MGFASAFFAGGSTSIGARAHKANGARRDPRAAMRREGMGFGVVLNPGLGPVDFDANGKTRATIKATRK
jgi:hypothetical protein